MTIIAIASTMLAVLVGASLPGVLAAQDADGVGGATELLMEGLPLVPERTLEGTFMKNRRLYDADTLDQRWPQRRPAEGFYWQSVDAIPERNTGAAR